MNAPSVMPTIGTYQDGKIRCIGGSSFRMVVELDPKGVKSWSILPYGESQNPDSPHYADQLPLFGKGQYKPTHFGLKNAQQTAKVTVTLSGL
jgi:acyl-homoserine lactone acylase PvdQ